MSQPPARADKALDLVALVISVVLLIGSAPVWLSFWALERLSREGL